LLLGLVDGASGVVGALLIGDDLFHSEKKRLVEECTKAVRRGGIIRNVDMRHAGEERRGFIARLTCWLSFQLRAIYPWTSVAGCHLLDPEIKSGFLETWYDTSSLSQRYSLVHTQIR